MTCFFYGRTLIVTALLCALLLLFLVVLYSYIDDALLLYLVKLPIYFHVLLLLNLGLWCWATNLHLLAWTGINTYFLLEAGSETTLFSAANLTSPRRSMRNSQSFTAKESYATLQQEMDHQTRSVPFVETSSSSGYPSRVYDDDILSQQLDSDSLYPSCLMEAKSSPTALPSVQSTDGLFHGGTDNTETHDACIHINDSSTKKQSIHQKNHSSTIRALYTMACGFTVLTLISMGFFQMFSRKWGEEAAEFVPLITYAIVLFLVVNPWPVLYYNERFKFLESLKRSAFGGLYSAVPFSDVILCDILTSFSRVVGDMQMVFCDLVLLPDGSDITSTYPNVNIVNEATTPSQSRLTFGLHRQNDNSHTAFNGVPTEQFSWSEVITPVLIAMPYVFRFRQCLSEFFLASDPQHKCRHMANAIKYLTSLPVILAAFQINRIQRSSHFGNIADPELHVVQFNSVVGLWVLFSLINSVYSLYWDIVVDWNLCAVPLARQQLYVHVHSPVLPSLKSSMLPSAPVSPKLSHNVYRDLSKQDGDILIRLYQRTRFLLRPILHFRYVTPYYVAIVLDCILRFSWTVKITFLYKLALVRGHHDNISRFVSDAQLLGTVAAIDLALKALEIIRRWVWVFFRIEREWVLKQGKSFSKN
ncbi:hypothetical protein BDV3_000682 [Batrachochytrium dendrobatidis]